jgi:cation diffusion facilitator family transporter
VVHDNSLPVYGESCNSRRIKRSAGGTETKIAATARSSLKRVIYAALTGNLLVAATKFVASGFTGSAAMLSEAIHSTVDSGNQLLLLLGISRAARLANARHPFGHGLQLYFWTFVVAVLIFGVGAGVSILEGISRIETPRPVENPWVNYLVLGLALLFEGAVWIVALRAFRETKGARGWLEAVHLSKTRRCSRCCSKTRRPSWACWPRSLVSR